MRVEGVVGADGMQEQTLKAAEILHDVLGVRVAGKGLVYLVLQTLKHPHGRVLLQSLPQVGPNLDEGCLGLECVLGEVWGAAPYSLRVEVLRLLIVEELVQDVLVVLVHQVEEVALGLYVGPPDVVLVNAVHSEQHLLIL